MPPDVCTASPRAPSLMGWGLIGAARAWQLATRPLAGCNCRFHPSCSDYGIEAVRLHGATRGSVLTARRILRCNPWHPGGYDPVPPHAHPAG